MHYELEATTGGPVTFRLIAGASERKAYSGGSWEAWDDDVAAFSSDGYFRNGLPVFRTVMALMSEWVRRERPFLFHFHATDEKKRRIYRRLVDRNAAVWAGQYSHFTDGPTFYFVRKQELWQ